MDWASSQWKEGLSSVALQKINILEEKIEKLQKERQQKQIQFECLELSLDKEKRKVEQEKQQTTRLERELQSLADTCKSLENKQQKLLTEIQNRDSRQNNLEAQLAQAKKQNCRLQQLEKDIEELRCLKENTKLEQKNLQEKLKKEQNTIVKQNDAISDLELTIKSLQDKKCTDKPVMMDANKENICSLKTGVNDKHSESLKKKILEQENIINSLKEQLKNISSEKEKMGPPSDILSPAKSNSSETPAKNPSLGLWDNFGSTPSKAGKVIKHHLDSSAFDDSDEKVHNLQLKVKQLSQELECQRHNSEAAKNALEQRLKEKENVLKAEVKQQAQTISDLDKELRDLQNKYQQDVVQSNKKLDIVNAQLQKSELSKQQKEKDLKTLELQLNSQNLELQQKSDELKDLHKLKNSLEVANKKLHLEKRELEQSNSALQAQKNSWSEQVRDLKMQLEGSNNLVKEKETLLHSLKKEHDYLTKVNSELQVKFQATNKDLHSTQLEKCNLEKQLQNLDTELSSLKENVKNISDEKKNVCSLLDLEKSKSAKLECALTENKKDNLHLQSEIKNNVNIIDSLKAELEQLRNNSEIKIKELENSLISSSAEISSLKAKLNDFSNKEIVSQENIKQLKKENDQISDSLKVLNSEKSSMETHIKELMSQLTVLQTDNKSKDGKINMMKQEAADLKQNYDIKVLELEKSVTSLNAEISSLKNKINEYAQNETSVQENMKKLKEENDAISNSLKAVNSDKKAMESHIKDLISQLAALQADNKSKEDKISLLHKETACIKERYNEQLNELKDNLDSIKHEKVVLEEQIKENDVNVTTLRSTINEREVEIQRLNELLADEGEKKSKLEAESAELKENLQQIKSEFNLKKEQLSKLSDDVETIKSEKATLESQLKETNANEVTLKSTINEGEVEIRRLNELLAANEENKNKVEAELAELKENLYQIKSELNVKEDLIKNIEKDKLDAAASLSNEKAKNADLEDKVTELNVRNSDLQCELKAAKESLNSFNMDILNCEKSYEEQMSKLKDDVEAIKSEKAVLELQVKENNVNEVTFKSVINERELEINRLSELLASKEESKSKLEAELVELNENLQQIKSELDLKEIQLQELKSTVENLKSKNETLSEQMNSFVTNEKNLKEVLGTLENEKNSVSVALESEIKRSKLLESEIEGLKNTISEMEYDVVTDVGNELLLKAEIDSLKCDFEAKKIELGNTIKFLKSDNEKLLNQVKDFVLNELSIRQALQKSENEKNHVLEVLLSETKKTHLLESAVANLRNNIISQDFFITSKIANELILKTEIERIKETFEDKIAKLQQSNESLTAEVTALQQELEKSSVKETALIKKTEAKVDCQNISQPISSEKELKSRVDVLLTELDEKNENIKSLESKLSSEKELKSRVDVLLTELDEKNESIKSLESELVLLKENYEDEISKLHQCNESLMAKVSAFQQELKENSTKETILLKKIEEAEVERQNVSLLISSERELKLRVGDLVTELNEKTESIKSLESEIGLLKENYEDKVSKLHQCNESLKTKVSVFQQELKENSTKETILLKKIEEAEVERQNVLQLISSERELKLRLDDLLTELNEKTENIKSLESEIALLKENYEWEKCQMSANIEDSKRNVQSVLDSLSNILSQNQVLQVEICDIKGEWQELQVKVAGDHKVRLELLNGFLDQLDTIESHVELLVQNHEEEIILLKNKLSEKESQFKSKCDEYDVWLEEKENLLSKIQCLEEKLENYSLNLNEHAVEVGNLKNDKETLNHVNKELQNEIVLLTGELQESLTLASIKSDEYDGIFEEKANLKKEIEVIEGKLNEKELEIKDLALFKIEQLIVVENLNNEKENLEQENKQLLEDISLLKHDLEEMVALATTKNDEYASIFEEKKNLENKLKLIERKLNEKELQLEDLVLFKSEQLTVIENLNIQKGKLEQENKQLMDGMLDLKNKLGELELQVTTKCQEYEIIFKENVNLNEKIRLVEERLNEKECELEKNSSVTNETYATVRDLENAKKTLLSENGELQLEILLMFDVLMTAESTLHKISSKITDILMNSKKAFQALQVLQKQNSNTSLDLSNFMSDCLNNKSVARVKSKEIQDVCQFILESLNIFEEHLAESQKLNIPESVMLENLDVDSYQEKSNDLNMNVKSCSQDSLQCSVMEKFASKYKDNLISNFKDIYDKITLFKEGNLAGKEKFQFLVHHELVAVADFRKILLTLKYMKKLHTKLHSKISALESLQSSKYQVLVSNYKPSGNIFSIINLLSGESIDQDVNLFFEQCLLVNTYKDSYVTSKLKKIFNSLASSIDAEILKFEEYFVCFKQYDNVNYHYLHKPIFIKTDSLLFLHRINADLLQTEIKPNLKIVSYKKNFEMPQIVPILNNLSAAKVPLLLNCLLELYEKIASKFDENSPFTNLISLIINKLVYFYEKNLSFASLEIYTYIKNFIHLVFDSCMSSERQFKLLQGCYSLLEYLCHIAELNETEKKEALGDDLFNSFVSEMNYLKSENDDVQSQIEFLKKSLRNEETQREILDLHLKEVCEKLNSVVTLKENWERKILEVSKLCSVLKNIVHSDCDILQLQSEFAALSDNFCLCEQCLITECESRVGTDHVIFTPVNLIHFIGELYTLKTVHEKEVTQLNAVNTDMNTKIASLEIELENARLTHTTLEQSLSELKEKANTKEYELGNLKTKYSLLEDEYQSLNTQFLDTNNAYRDLQKMFDAKLNDFNKCKLQYKEAFSENMIIKDEIAQKEQKIIECEKIIAEKVSEYESLLVKSKDYETKIEESNDVINNLSSHEEEITQLNKVNADMNKKITSLESELENARLTHTTLEQSLSELKEKASVKEQELENLTTKYSLLEKEYQSLNTQLNDLNKCKLQYEEAFSENVIIKDEIAQKEQKIIECEKIIAEKVSEYESLLVKSKDYETKIEESNDIINNLSSHEEEITQLNKVNSDMNKKIASLESELENARLTHTTLEQSLSELKEKASVKEQELENLTTKYSLLEKEYQSLNTQLNDLNKCKLQYEEAFSENVIIKDEIAQKEQKIIECEKIIAEKVSEYESLLVKSKDYETKIEESNDIINNLSSHEEEITQLNKVNSDMNKKIASLESELENARLTHTTLEQSLSELKEKASVKEQELENLTTKYSLLEKEYQSLNTQLNDLNKCKLQYEEAFSENVIIKDGIAQKEQKIIECEKIIAEKVSECESLLAKSKDYETKIEESNDIINNLSSRVKELYDKVVNLETSSNLLNATLENVELELQNTYLEKQKLEENLKKKIDEVERLQQEITATGSDRAKAAEEISNLELSIEKFKDDLQNSRKECTELQKQNSYSTNIIRELKISVLGKDSCIQKKDSTIDQLKKTMSECDNERQKLEIEINGLSDELAKKNTLLSDLENKVSKVVAEKEDLQKHNVDLLSIKQNEEKYQTKCNILVSENTSLKLELENIAREKSDLENQIKAYCDKICAIEAELEKTLKFRDILSKERDDLKRKLNSLMQDIRFKNKSLLENSLLIQELTQKVDKLGKEISESAQISGKKINELTFQNSSLLSEINALKSQLRIDCTHGTVRVNESFNFKASDNLKNFLEKLINLLAEAFEKIECSSDVEKSKAEFVSELKNWENNIVYSDSYISDMCKKLHSFLQHYISNQKDLESKLENLAKAALKHVVELNKYSELNELNPNSDVTALGDISCLNDTLCADNPTSNAFSNCDINKLTNELQKSSENVDLHYNSLKNTILKKEMEIKSLQDSLTKVKQSIDSLPNENQGADFQALKGKCDLLRSNGHRLEKKHKKLLKTCEELENRIETLEKEKQDLEKEKQDLEKEKQDLEKEKQDLEKEKQELETEAEEMAALIRDQTSSDEVLETSKRLAESNKQLEIFKEENNNLKAVLRQYKAKETSMNVSKAAEQRDSSEIC